MTKLFDWYIFLYFFFLHNTERNETKRNETKRKHRTGKLIEHYCDTKTHRWVRHKPKTKNNGSNNNNGNDDDDGDDDADWQLRRLQIIQTGDAEFRALCVESVENSHRQSPGSCLAHRLWGPDVSAAQRDLGVVYVMELRVRLIGPTSKRQIERQLSALGFPLVGDKKHGGGQCQMYHDRHGWDRLALQCCQLEFPEPEKRYSDNDNDEGGNGNDHRNKKQQQQQRHRYQLEASDRICRFTLKSAWWTPFLVEYEACHQAGRTLVRGSGKTTPTATTISTASTSTTKTVTINTNGNGSSGSGK